MDSPGTTDSSAATAGGTRPHRRIYRDRFLFSVLVLSLVADQLTKQLVVTSMRLGESVPAQGFLRITYVTNTGSIFGLFQGQTFALSIASFVGVAVLLYFYHAHQLPGLLLRTSLGLQLGGAIGNLADRLRLGHVVDFIDVGRWPIFNLADSSIVIGITVLVSIFMLEERASKRGDSRPAPLEEGKPATDD